MKKFKVFSLILIIIMTASLFTGCNMVLGPISATKVFTKYEEMAAKYNKTDDLGIIYNESLFNNNNNLIITYKDSNFSYEVNARPSSIFNVFKSDGGYPQTLYAVLSFFNQYRTSLNLNSNKWSAGKIKNVYMAMLDFDDALGEFQVQKRAMETLNIVYDEGATNPYSNNILIKYDIFKQAYNNLIEKTLVFAKLFERTYVEDVLDSTDFLTQTEVQYYEIRRVAYTANVYLADASYNYYIKHLDDYTITSANNSLFNSMIGVKTKIESEVFLDATVVNTETRNYYRTTRLHEQQVIAQSGFYSDAINNASALKNSSIDSEILMYNDYLMAIDSTTANYINYSSYVLELINKITD